MLNKRLRKRWAVAVGLVVATVAAVQVARSYLREDERRMRMEIRAAVQQKYPETVERLKATYGLQPFGHVREPLGRRPPPPVAILIHGLDDPGKVWMNLAPALDRDGFRVWIMTYPNDQPIADSARFFLEQIADLHLAGARKTAIVAHSMGGLVAREMLTCPELDYAGKAAAGQLPAVDPLVMVGTPNHGSELAHFRMLTEFRDQFEQLLKDDYHWLQAVVDGLGEAGIDLLPGSRFLETLNRRPRPPMVDMLVIAGVLGPRPEEPVQRMGKSPGDEGREKSSPTAEKLRQVLASMAQKVGDGLVAVESARLPGVELRIVTGSHLSIIRNITAASRRVPPAVPVIVERLHRGGVGG